MFQILFVIALCADAFMASFAYGTENARIPAVSAVVISAISTAVLAMSVGFGSVIKQIIPGNISGIICFIILFLIGLIKSFESLLKNYISKSQEKKRKLRMKLFDLNFILTVYVDNIKADADNSKVLSPKEAVYLAAALSFDSLAAGIGFGMTDFGFIELLLFSLISNLLAVSLGHILGKLVNRISNFDFSWLGGVILIILAFTKL